MFLFFIFRKNMIFIAAEVLKAIAHGTCIISFVPRPAPINKIIFIDTVGTYCGSLGMALNRATSIAVTAPNYKRTIFAPGASSVIRL